MIQTTIFDAIYPKFKIDKPIRLIEFFAGYGSQALALKYLGVPFEHWKICEWAVKSIQAYKDIHFTNEHLTFNNDRIKEEMVDYLYKLGISSNYNEPMTKEQINRLNEEQLKTILENIAITHNLVNIQQVKGEDLKIVDTDKYEYMLTYSFPCQDLSLAGKGKGMSDTSTRSGMLWEVERILKEMHKKKKTLPRFLVMENVTNILSKPHEEDFNDWKSTLEKLGYKNKIYRLNARYFGVPQNRPRAYMISVRCDNKKRIEKRVDAYFENHNLEDVSYSTRNRRRNLSLKDILKVDYSLEKYKIEADLCKPNDTVSRRKIYEDNDHLVINNEVQDIIVNTVTTKQDRNPNSGVIDYKNYARGKAKWRYLTPRECLMLMGFDEEDYDNIIEGNIALSKNRNLFTIEKLIKLAGNSIVVDVLEAIFTQILEINKTIFNKE